MTKGCQPNKTYQYGTWNCIRNTEILQLLCSGHNFTPSLWSCLTVFHLFYFKPQSGGNLRGFPLHEANTLKRWLHLEEKQIPASYLSLLKNCEHFQVAKETKDQTECYSTFRSYDKWPCYATTKQKIQLRWSLAFAILLQFISKINGHYSYMKFGINKYWCEKDNPFSPEFKLFKYEKLTALKALL